jgi:hypothetical protein
MITKARLNTQSEEEDTTESAKSDVKRPGDYQEIDAE